VVYGVLTEETGMDEVLINRLDYDGVLARPSTASVFRQQSAIR
jgi:hypothetical protein